jgi:hypothetical protein
MGISNPYTYLVKRNADKINYKGYLEKGWHIGSGPMESANKTVARKRMKQSGMRWNINLALRACHKFCVNNFLNYGSIRI